MMKRLCFAALIFFSLSLRLTAAKETTAATPEASGYLVEVQISVGETGKVENAKIVSSEDKNLDSVALDIARERTFPVKSKDGASVKYTVTMPMNFPVDGDQGAAAQKDLPKLIARSFPMPRFRIDSIIGRAGGVMAELSIDRNGQVVEVKIVDSSNLQFELPAIEAMRQWRFEPPVKEGKKVAVKVYQAIAISAHKEGIDWRWYVAPRPCLPNLEISATPAR